MRIILVSGVYGARRGIGFEGKLPWPKHLEDMRHFAKLTAGKVVIMGSTTWRSIKNGLPGRKCIVLTSDPNTLEGDAYAVTSMEDALSYARDSCGAKEVYVVGGESVYKQFLPLADEIVLSKIPPVDGSTNPKFDTFFPYIDRVEWEVVVTERKPSIQPGFTSYLLIENWEKITDV